MRRTMFLKSSKESPVSTATRSLKSSSVIPSGSCNTLSMSCSFNAMSKTTFLSSGLYIKFGVELEQACVYFIIKCNLFKRDFKHDFFIVDVGNGGLVIVFTHFIQRGVEC